jgi:hypothetical protein
MAGQLGQDRLDRRADGIVGKGQPGQGSLDRIAETDQRRQDSQNTRTTRLEKDKWVRLSVAGQPGQDS